MYNTNRRTQSKRTQKGSSIVEFTLCMFVVFLSIFGLINLVMISASVAGAYFITTYSAVSAATQTSYDRALASSTYNCLQLMNSGFASWVKMKPVAGFANSGLNLYVEERNQNTSTTRMVGPNTPVPAPIDTAANVYEYTADCTYDVGPFVNMSSFPGLNQIPFLGKPARLHCTASRAVEHPEGLTGYGTLTSLAKVFNGLPAGFTVDPTGAGKWINPGDVITQPGSGISYVLVNDPQGAGAYLLQISLDHQGHLQTSGQSLELTVEFHGVHLTPSANGMTNQLETFMVQDATGHATSYTVDPGQDIGLRNMFTVGWNRQSQNGNSIIAVQNFVQQLNYTQGAGFLPAVEAGWTHFANWYGSVAQDPTLFEGSTTPTTGYATTSNSGVAVTSAGTISRTPSPTISMPGVTSVQPTVSGPLDNNPLGSSIAAPTPVVVGVSDMSEGADPARFSNGP